MLIGVSAAKAEEEHCLVTQAIAAAGNEARMDLLIGTDDIFTAAYYAEKEASKKVRDKYKALFAARDKKGGNEDPENGLGGSFGSPAEREQYFRNWTTDIKALEAAENSEIADYAAEFRRAMKADTNPATKRRLARIDALWKKEFYAPCYWGLPK